MKDIREQARNPLRWVALSVLVLDVMFLIWGVVRLVFIAFPGLQFSIVALLLQVLQVKSESQIDPVYNAFRTMFLLPAINRFNILPDALLNAFLTALCVVLGFAIYKWIDVFGKFLAKQS